MRKHIMTVVLAVAVLLASLAPCAQAQQLPLDVRKPTISLLASPTPAPSPTVEPTPKPGVSPASNEEKEKVNPPVEQEKGWDWDEIWSWIILLVGIGVAILVVIFLVKTFKSKNPRYRHTREETGEHQPNPEVNLAIQSAARLTPPGENSRPPVVSRQLHAVEEQPTAQPPAPLTVTADDTSITQLVEEPPATIALPPNPTPSSSDTAAVPRPKGPGVSVIVFLALGLAQAGTAFADCAPIRVTLGQKVVMGQSKPQKFELVVNKECSKITAIGGLPWVSFTNVKHDPNIGMVTADVMATNQAEGGPTQFSFLDNGKEIVSPPDVVVTFLDRSATHFHNELDEFKTDTNKAVSGLKTNVDEVKKGVASLNGKIDEVRQEVQTKTDQVKVEVKTDLEQTKKAIDEAVAEALKSRDEQIWEVATGLKRTVDAIRYLGRVDSELARSPTRKGFFGGKKQLNPELADPKNPKNPQKVLDWILSGKSQEERDR